MERPLTSPESRVKLDPFQLPTQLLLEDQTIDFTNVQIGTVQSEIENNFILQKGFNFDEKINFFLQICHFCWEEMT